MAAVDSLGSDYFWIDAADSANLRFRYACAASISTRSDGTVQVVIFWNSREVRGSAGSVAQGKRFTEKWLKARISGRARPRKGFVHSDSYRKNQQALGEFLRQCAAKDTPAPRQ